MIQLGRNRGIARALDHRWQLPALEQTKGPLQRIGDQHGIVDTPRLVQTPRA